MKASRKDFLEALFGEYFAKREGFILVRASRRLDPRVSTRFFPNVEILAKEQYQEDQNVFFSVCCREGMKMDRHYVQYMTAIWAGLDFTPDGYSGKSLYFANKAHAAKAIRSFPLPPSIIVESGWGVHLYWLLAEMTQVTDIVKIERILTKVNSYFRCTSPVRIDSTLRLPETFNCRMPGELTRCFAKYVNSDFRYDLDEFEKLKIGPNRKEALPGPLLRAPTNIVALNEMSQVVESIGIDLEELEQAADRSFRQSGTTSPKAGRSSQAPGSRVIRVLEDTAAAIPESQSRKKRAGTAPVPETTSTEVVEAEEFSDALADEIAEKVVARLSDELADRLSDKVVAKLYELLKRNGQK